MQERWRKPLRILDIVEDSDTAVRNGRDQGWYRGINLTTDADGYDRLRTGYACIQCFEPFEAPWPENCPLCQFEVRRLQPQAFEHEFYGEKHVGPSTSLSDELERLDYTADKMRWERDPVHGVLVPREVV